MLTVSLKKNDKKARLLIYLFSFVVFAAVVILGEITLEVELPFDKHIFATLNAFINTVVSCTLVYAFVAIKQKKYLLHKNLMMGAMLLSVLFLVSYIAHHLLAGEARFGDTNHDGIADQAEKLAAGNIRYFYYFILFTHIPLAAIILPFILFTAYRSMIGEFDKHKKLARYTLPLWLYVSITGVIVYILISPYYQ